MATTTRARPRADSTPVPSPALPLTADSTPPSSTQLKLLNYEQTFCVKEHVAPINRTR